MKETAICTLCAKIESSGFYTGCLIKDGHDCNGWQCDGNGNLTRENVDPMQHDPRDDDDGCPICGGEGFTFDCFDGCCEDVEIGCDDCTRSCECQRASPVSRPNQPAPEE